MKNYLNATLRSTAAVMVVLFGFNLVVAPVSYAQVAFLPAAGSMVNLTPKFDPMLVKGIKLYPDNPFKFDFIVDTGDAPLSQADIKAQGEKLVSYFLASLTTPEKEMWVNLSPYEKNRIIPDSFGQTEMGKEILSQDYVLKQIMATALYPEKQLGKEFWKKIYAQAAAQFGGANVPVSTFNKVWILPNKATVFQNAKMNTVFVVQSSLKVMLEQDYLAANQNKAVQQLGMSGVVKADAGAMSALSSRIIKEVVIPALEKEVNEGKNFAPLRQVYGALILASWYKKNLKDNVLAQAYVNRNKTMGIDVEDKEITQKIYQQYLQAYRKGVYNYIKEDKDASTGQMIPRKYFSGGLQLAVDPVEVGASDRAMISFKDNMAGRDFVTIGAGAAIADDQAPGSMRYQASIPSTKGKEVTSTLRQNSRIERAFEYGMRFDATTAQLLGEIDADIEFGPDIKKIAALGKVSAGTIRTQTELEKSYTDNNIQLLSTAYNHLSPEQFLSFLRIKKAEYDEMARQIRSAGRILPSSPSVKFIDDLLMASEKRPVIVAANSQIVRELIVKAQEQRRISQQELVEMRNSLNETKQKSAERHADIARQLKVLREYSKGVLTRERAESLGFDKVLVELYFITQEINAINAEMSEVVGNADKKYINLKVNLNALEARKKVLEANQKEFESAFDNLIPGIQNRIEMAEMNVQLANETILLLEGNLNLIDSRSAMIQQNAQRINEHLNVETAKLAETIGEVADLQKIISEFDAELGEVHRKINELGRFYTTADFSEGQYRDISVAEREVLARHANEDKLEEKLAEITRLEAEIKRITNDQLEAQQWLKRAQEKKDSQAVYLAGLKERYGVLPKSAMDTFNAGLSRSRRLDGSAAFITVPTAVKPIITLLPKAPAVEAQAIAPTPTPTPVLAPANTLSTLDQQIAKIALTQEQNNFIGGVHEQIQRVQGLIARALRYSDAKLNSQGDLKSLLEGWQAFFANDPHSINTLSRVILANPFSEDAQKLEAFGNVQSHPMNFEDLRSFWESPQAEGKTILDNLESHLNQTLAELGRAPVADVPAPAPLETPVRLVVPSKEKEVSGRFAAFMARVKSIFPKLTIKRTSLGLLAILSGSTVLSTPVGKSNTTPTIAEQRVEVDPQITYRNFVELIKNYQIAEAEALRIRAEAEQAASLAAEEAQKIAEESRRAAEALESQRLVSAQAAESARAGRELAIAELSDRRALVVRRAAVQPRQAGVPAVTTRIDRPWQTRVIYASPTLKINGQETPLSTDVQRKILEQPGAAYLLNGKTSDIRRIAGVLGLGVIVGPDGQVAQLPLNGKNFANYVSRLTIDQSLANGVNVIAPRLAANNGGIDLENVNVDAQGGEIKTGFSDKKVLDMLIKAQGLKPVIYNVNQMTLSQINLLLGI